MRIIFLDIDGVLVLASRGALSVLPDAVAHLNRLTESTQAQIVITSSWRKWSPIKQLARGLQKGGVKATIIGATPIMNDAERGDEIAAWLRAHAHDVSFVILDDDSDMGALIPRLVQTDPEHGLRAEDVDRAIAILEGQQKEPRE